MTTFVEVPMTAAQIEKATDENNNLIGVEIRILVLEKDIKRLSKAFQLQAEEVLKK